MKPRRQPNSLKIWIAPNDMFWASVRVHEGRSTKLVRGPLAPTVDGAVQALNEAVNGV